MTRRNRMPRRMDAGGERMRRARFDSRALAEAKADEIERQREAKIVKLPVPTLGTVEEIDEIIGNPDAIPFFAVDRDIPIRSLGKAIFGPDGYNLIANRQNERDVGPHFDDYRAGFSSWSIHVDNSSNGTVRGIILPQDVWEKYQAEFSLDQIDQNAQRTRRELGKKALIEASTVFTTELNPDINLVLWQGDETIPPSVHDIQRHSRHSIVLSDNGGFSLNLLDSITHDYTVYARTHFEEVPEGFAPV